MARDHVVAIFEVGNVFVMSKIQVWLIVLAKLVMATSMLHAGFALEDDQESATRDLEGPPSVGVSVSCDAKGLKV